MPKRLTDIEKKDIIQSFSNGESLDSLAKKFGCTKLTISRNIKKSIGPELFNNLNKNTKNDNNNDFKNEIFKGDKLDPEIKLTDKKHQKESNNRSLNENQFLQNSSFTELVPLDLDIDNSPRKDCSSIHIDEINFPEIVYLIVDKKIELETKVLKDYPEWQFLPQEDLLLTTIEIYFDLKVAKRDCKKDQKVIKVTNPNVFKIASKIMISRGITRIICDKQLISL